MTKPLNTKDSRCTPVSSDCVIYQGGEVCEDIILCKGDSVSDVLEKVMSRICEINYLLNPDNYTQPECLAGLCGNTGFISMIENMMSKICDTVSRLESLTTTVNGIEDNISGDKSPDEISRIQREIVALNEKLATIRSENSSQVKSLQDSIDDKFKAYETIVAHNDDIRTVYKKANDAALDNKSIRNDIGSSGSIATAVNRIIGNSISNRRMLSRPIVYSNSEQWISNATGLGDAISNMMVVINDLLSATSPMYSDYSGTDCSAIDINVEVDAVDTNHVRIAFTGTIPNGFTDAASGSTIQIYERNNAVPMTINNVNIVEQYFRASQVMDVTLAGITASSNLTVRVMLRTYAPSAGTSCERFFEGYGLGVVGCPNVIYTSAYNSCNFQFSWSGESTVMSLQLYDATETLLLQQLSVNAGGENVTGIIVNLDEGTTYKARLVINGQNCDFKAFTTAVRSCIEVPDNTLLYEDDFTDPQGLTTGDTISDWINDYNNQ